MADILIVDDDQKSIQLMTEYLSAFGHSPDFLLEAEYFFQKLEKGLPDLILLDIYMPQVDGVTLLNQLKSHPVYRSIPVVMITASEDEKLLSFCFELGAMDYITKPIKDLVLKARIKSTLATNENIRILTTFKEDLEKEVNRRTEELRESESKYRSLVEQIPAITYLAALGSSGSTLYVSPQIKEILGFTQEEWNNNPKIWSRQLHPSDRKRVLDTVSRCVKNNEPFDSEYRLIHKDGEPLWFHDKAVVILNNEGKPLYLQGVIHDISKRKQAEEALRASEEKYHALMEDSGEAILLTDMEGNLIEANKSAERLLGYTREEILTMHYIQIHPKGDLARTTFAFNEMIRKGYVCLNDGLLLRKDGKIVRVDITGSVIEYGGKRVAQGVFRDITARKLAEEKEKHHQEKLQQANKMTSLGNLVTSVAHEINNPNCLISLGISTMEGIWNDLQPLLIEKEKTTKKGKPGNRPDTKALELFNKTLETIRDGSKRINKITSELLEFSHSDESKYEDHVNVEKVLQNSVKLTERLIKKSTSKFTTHISSLPMVIGNSQKLDQVMVNLIINACHALTDSHQPIEMRAYHDQTNNMNIIQIEDKGMGMDNATLNRVLEPFFTTKKDTGGTGLGTSISYGIIKEHGGFIEYESEPGNGTTVTVAIPVAKG